MKRVVQYMIVFILGMVSVQLTGCSARSVVENRIKYAERKAMKKLVKEQQNQIMEGFVNNDKEEIRAFFSEYIVEKYSNIDEQIEKAIALLDGRIISYDAPSFKWGGSVEKKRYGAKSYNVRTDKGTEYIIGSKWYTYDKASKKIRAKFIYVINETKRLQLEGTDDKAVKEKFFVGIGEL